MPIKLDPIKQCTLFLAIYAAFALGFNISSQVTLHLLCTVGFSLVLYSAYSWIFPNKHKNPWDTAITGLILFLILHYGSSAADLVFPLTATFLAISIKFFVEFKSSPVVNPAAAGLLLSALILAFLPGLEHPFVSWWGASFWIVEIGSFQFPLSLVLLLGWMFLGVPAWRRGWAVLSFLLFYAIGLLVRGQGLESVQFVFTDSMIYFYATIMLMEPKTSPFKPGQQVAYGSLAAILTHALLSVAAPYPELFGLVGANLFQTALRHFPKKGTPVD